MEKIIGLKELRRNVTKYADKVRRGYSFIVVKRSRPLFKISSITDNAVWETVADFTASGGVRAEELLRNL